MGGRRDDEGRRRPVEVLRDVATWAAIGMILAGPVAAGAVAMAMTPAFVAWGTAPWAASSAWGIAATAALAAASAALGLVSVAQPATGVVVPAVLGTYATGGAIAWAGFGPASGWLVRSLAACAVGATTFGVACCLLEAAARRHGAARERRARPV